MITHSVREAVTNSLYLEALLTVLELMIYTVALIRAKLHQFYGTLATKIKKLVQKIIHFQFREILIPQLPMEMKFLFLVVKMMTITNWMIYGHLT